MTDEDLERMLLFADDGGDGSVRMAEFVNIFSNIRCKMKPVVKMNFWRRLFHKRDNIEDEDDGALDEYNLV